MSCGSCAAKISQALSELVGVVHAAVEKKTDSAVVDYVEGKTSVAELCAVISDLGFGAMVGDDQLSEFELSDTSGRLKAGSSMHEPSREAELDVAAPVKEHILYIGGMTCEKCLEWISKAVRRVSGVQDVSISLSNKCAKIRGRMDIGRVKANIIETGYSVYTDENDVPDYPAAPKDSLIPPHSSHSLERRNSVSLSVSGMTCASCSSKIQRNLSQISGVLEASVNLLGEKATILTDGSVDANTLVQSVSGMGFIAKALSQDSGRKISLFVQGMVCASCPPRIELALSQMSGIQSVSADLNLERVVVVYDAPLGPRGIIAKLVDLGYDAELWDKEEEDSTSRYSKSDEIKERFRQFMTSMIFTLPIFLLMMVFMYIPGLKSKLMTEVIFSYDGPGIKLPAAWLVSFLLATPVQFWVGARFYTGAYRALRNGSANMDVLIAMGTSAAYFYSVYVVIDRIFNPSMSGHQFFETSAMLISFVMMGKWLEALTKGKTSEAIQKLMELQPDTAIILEFDVDGKISREVEISMRLLQSGDLVKVLPGTRVPCDGEVVMGDTSVDEAMVTGESMPKGKGPGDKVIGGTVNQTGLLHVRAEGVGEASMLSGIIRLVEDAQTSKAPIQAYADYISARFVPGVVFVSACTLVIWYALAASGSIPGDWTKKEGSDFLFAFMFAISVLVIACPCALGLAVP
ncbi:copper-transporting ATPase, partial [Cymbomonas tetramitiformis]